jgi:hypothetical protein
MTIEGVGEHRPDNVRGVLVFSHLPDEIQRLEDARLDADTTRARQSWFAQWSRPATDTERALLEHLGYGPLPAELWTKISYLTNNVRHRSWPALGI